MRPNVSGDTLEKTLQDLHVMYPNAFLEYYSPRDNDRISGIEIEQFVSESLFSGYTPKGQKILFKTFDGRIRLVSQDELLTPTSGLIVDTIHKKMYFNGVRLTSKDFASQTTTSDLLELLSDNK